MLGFVYFNAEGCVCNVNFAFLSGDNCSEIHESLFLLCSLVLRDVGDFLVFFTYYTACTPLNFRLGGVNITLLRVVLRKSPLVRAFVLFRRAVIKSPRCF